MTEDDMVGWHHRVNGHEFEQTPGDGEGQGSLQSMGSQRVGHNLGLNNTATSGWGLWFLQKNSKMLCIFFQEEPGFCSKAVLLFLGCSSILSSFPPFPD